MFTLFGFVITAQLFWFYVIIATTVFFGLEITNPKSDFQAVWWRLGLTIFWPLFWVICAVKKL